MENVTSKINFQEDMPFDSLDCYLILQLITIRVTGVKAVELQTLVLKTDQS